MGKRPLTELIKEYQLLVAEVARLQAEVDRERPAALAALPATYGYPDMDSFIKAVVRACRKSRPRTAARAPKPQTQPANPALGNGVAKATKPASESTDSTRPSSTSLDDPKNFELMPDLTLLEGSGGNILPHQAKLTEALKFTQQVLHTSGVPATIWREWRQFERKATELLRTLNTVVRTEEE